MGFGVNRDAGKPGKEAVAKQAGFASENSVFMEAGRHVGEPVLPDFHQCLGLGDGNFGQADCDLPLAILGSDSRGHPLQSGRTAGIEPDPLLFVSIHLDLHAHAALP